MAPNTKQPILAAFFEEHEFGTFLPVEEVVKRIRQDITGQGFQVEKVTIFKGGTLVTWRRKGNGRWEVLHSTALRADEKGVKVPSRSLARRGRQTPPKRRGRRHQR